MEQATSPSPEALASVPQADQQAQRLRAERDWNLAVFVAAFGPDLKQVLLVQLGDYARPRFGGNPWTLPGGSVEPDEAPSVAACRELREEAGLEVSSGRLRLAGWFPRRNHTPHHRDRPGELLLLFAAEADPQAVLRPSPPEVLAARFVAFDLDDWLAVPATGTGAHPLQPLPRHWVYWAHLARLALRDPARAPACWSYERPGDLTLPPWPADGAPR